MDNMAEETPNQTLELAPEGKKDVGEMSQGQLMVRRFMQSKLSVFGGIVIILFYIVVVFAEFFAPYSHDEQYTDTVWAPPTKLRFQGGKLGVYAMKTVLNSDTFTWEFVEDPETFLPLRFFIKSWNYRLVGLIPTNIHLFGVDEPGKVFLLGTDTIGRCVLSRIIIGSRISMSIGLVGIVMQLVLGSIIGTISGFMGGAVDNLIQRGTELLRSFPEIPLFAALAGSLPRDMPIVQRFMLISVILSLIRWVGLAREVRGKVMAYRAADYTQAARAAGASNMHIVFTHMIPNASSHIIVVATLSIPGMVAAETSLSFLGLGIQPPQVSWGLLLRVAQNVTAVLQHPWELTPVIAVIIAVTCFYFLGDGMRDAVDPYG